MNHGVALKLAFEMLPKPSGFIPGQRVAAPAVAHPLLWSTLYSILTTAGHQLRWKSVEQKRATASIHWFIVIGYQYLSSSPSNQSHDMEMGKGSSPKRRTESTPDGSGRNGASAGFYSESNPQYPTIQGIKTSQRSGSRVHRDLN